MSDMGGLLKFMMVAGSVITAIVSGTQLKAALIQAVYHVQNYSMDQTEYYTSQFGANAMQLTEESISDANGDDTLNSRSINKDLFNLSSAAANGVQQNLNVLPSPQAAITREETSTPLILTGRQSQQNNPNFNSTTRDIDDLRADKNFFSMREVGQEDITPTPSIPLRKSSLQEILFPIKSSLSQ